MNDVGLNSRLLGVLLLLVLGTQAHAMVLCATRRGDVVAAERCRKREVQLDTRDLGVIAPAGLPGPAGPAGPDGASIERPFRVVDGNGVTACTALGADGRYYQCILSPDPQSDPVQLVLYRNGNDPERPLVYYASPGCQGASYSSEPASLVARATVLGSRLVIPNGPLMTVAVLSAEQAGDQCPGGTPTADGACCRNVSPAVEITAAPARQVSLSALGLAAPLHVEVP